MLLGVIGGLIAIVVCGYIFLIAWWAAEKGKGGDGETRTHYRRPVR